MPAKDRRGSAVVRDFHTHRTRVGEDSYPQDARESVEVPAEGAGGDDGVVPDPCLVEGAVGSTICVLDEWLA
jgi:hypothetical protein